MNLKGKTVVVVGATGGIGREVVKNLDSEGVNLILVSKTESELQNLLQSLDGEENKYYVCDFSNTKETQDVVLKISKENENIDLVINCAGVGIYKPLIDLNLEDFEKSISINTTSVFLFMKYLMSNLEKSDNSLILNIGSGAGVIPMSGRSVYCTSKFAVRGLTLSLAEEYKRIGNPKFCLITLGSTLTSFGPMSFEEKKNEMENGKAYFTPEWVSEKIIEIIKNDGREVEYTLYPGDYGFGEWSKPDPR